jgi:hypothetical protein
VPTAPALARTSNRQIRAAGMLTMVLGRERLQHSDTVRRQRRGKRRELVEKLPDRFPRCPHLGDLAHTLRDHNVTCPSSYNALRLAQFAFGCF